MLALFLALGASTTANAATNMHVCDYYKMSNTPCVAAHSTTRALYAGYTGSLYAVQRKSDGTSKDIGLLPNGYANAAAQDSFCAGTTCIITFIYDQSGQHNDLKIEPGHTIARDPPPSCPPPSVVTPPGNKPLDNGAPADALPVTAGGHQVYGVSFSGRMGYRNAQPTSGVATYGKPESAYMVTSGTHTNGQCCFDYGNAEHDIADNGSGHMDAVNFSSACLSEPSKKPWVKADLENGLYASNKGCAADARQPEPYVTALLKNNGQNAFTLKYGNAQTGWLTTAYAGPLPPPKLGSPYSPMCQEGGIVLGTGGDDTANSIGSFFEGVMTAGVPSDAADDQVQQDIVAVGYGGPTGLAGALQLGDEISLMTEQPNASIYLAHRKRPEDEEKVVGRHVDKASPVEHRESATWIVRHGFTGSGCLAFESRDLPGAFLSHDADALVVVPDDGSATFAGNSTFCPVAGLAGSGSSFKAQNLAGAYIKISDHRGVLVSPGGAQRPAEGPRFKEDASFVVTQPLAP